MQQRFLLQILLFAQHVSGITMPIIRSSTHLVTNLDNTRHLRLRTQIPQKLTKLFLNFYSTKYHTQQPLYNTLELLMMGMVMPETC